MGVKNKIYIQSATHISAQYPLAEDWMDNPLLCDAGKMSTIEVQYRDYLSPNAARRMGKLLKRALVCARVAMKRAEIAYPDAVVSATGLGCIENTEIFLDAEERSREGLLNPTPFMLSTHNTIGSTIAIETHCAGYNTHYSQKFMSFDCALFDTCMQLQTENIHTVLLNGHDESSPIFDGILEHLNKWDFKKPWFKGETAVAMVLGKEHTASALCRIEDMMMYYHAAAIEMKERMDGFLHRNACRMSDIDAVFVGLNGNEDNDQVYLDWQKRFFLGTPMAYYKHLFGEHYTMSGIGIYVAATCLQQGRIPSHLLWGEQEPLEGIRRILFCNHSEAKEYSFILLSRIR